MLNVPSENSNNLRNRTTTPFGSSRNSGYDYLGAFVRRKWIVIMPAVVGAVLGFYYFSTLRPVYSSSLRLMIWTQAPPSLVHGETINQPVTALGKHQNLLASQVVLANAIREGDLRATETFRGNPEPLGALQGMLSVSPVPGAAETLNLSIRGPVAVELPMILEQVSAAFQRILSEDTRSVGKESAELIEKLQMRISEEKGNAEKRYLELIQKLNISPDAKSGQFINPYAEQVAQLQSRIDQKELEFSEISTRLQGVMDIKDQSGENKAESLQVVILEASKYLGINQKDDLSGDSELTARQERQLNILEVRISDAESVLADLQLKGRKLSESVGVGHFSAVANATEIRLYESQLKDLQAQHAAVLEEIATLKQDALKTSENVSISQASKKDQELVRIYVNSLVREQSRMKAAIKELKELRSQQDKLSREARTDIEELNILSLEIAQKDSVTREIVNRLGELSVLSGNFTSTKVRIIDKPGVGNQIEPRLSKYLPMGAMLGAVLGFALVLLLDRSDLSFHNPAEIQDTLGVPAIARIPRIVSKEKFEDGRSSQLVTINNPTSAAAEAYRACRTALLFHANQSDSKVFLVSSPSAGDGKSTSATNLALSFAQAGHRTVLVDADLRKPRCTKYLGEKHGVGLKELAGGNIALQELARPCHLSESLHFIGAGGHLANSSEFLGSPNFKALLAHLRESFDFVIIDSPPILPVADATALSSLCDAVVLVIKIRKGVALAARKAMEAMNRVEANVVGVVVNSVDGRSHYSEYGKYGYNGYGGYSYYANRYYERENKKYYVTKGAESE